MVRSTFSSFPHSKCRRLILATSRMNFFRKTLGKAENQTRGCWVRSANATSELCRPLLVSDVSLLHYWPLKIKFFWCMANYLSSGIRKVYIWLSLIIFIRLVVWPSRMDCIRLTSMKRTYWKKENDFFVVLGHGCSRTTFLKEVTFKVGSMSYVNVSHHYLGQWGLTLFNSILS